MRRLNPPFNGKQFVLNKNTGEIHNLDNETEQCHINSINPEHIYMGSSYLSCLLALDECKCPKNNGCHFCLPEKDSG